MIRLRPRAFSGARSLVAAAGALLVAAVALAPAQAPKKVDVLRIGSSDSTGGAEQGSKEDAALKSLREFIKEETGFANEIVSVKTGAELAGQLAESKLHLGIFPGHEFAWARSAMPRLQPLAVAVNVHRYREAIVLLHQGSPIKDFAGLKGRSLALPKVGLGFLKLYVERQSEAQLTSLAAFFTRIAEPDNMEDALDDVVDKTVDAVVVDRVGLEAYRRRKPGRASDLRVLVQSQPFPPSVIASYQGGLDQATLQRFRDGLLSAHKKVKGQKLLSLFRITAFEPLPTDLDKMLEATRKAYPAPKLTNEGN